MVHRGQRLAPPGVVRGASIPFAAIFFIFILRPRGSAWGISGVFLARDKDGVYMERGRLAFPVTTTLQPLEEKKRFSRRRER